MGMTFTSTTALYDEGSGGFFCSIKDRNEEIVARVFGNSPERAERRASELLAAWTAAQSPQGERVERWTPRFSDGSWRPAEKRTFRVLHGVEACEKFNALAERAERAEADLQSLRDFDRRHYLAARDSMEQTADVVAEVEDAIRRCGGKPGVPWCADSRVARHSVDGLTHVAGACRPCLGCPDCAPAPSAEDETCICGSSRDGHSSQDGHPFTTSIRLTASTCPTCGNDTGCHEVGCAETVPPAPSAEQACKDCEGDSGPCWRHAHCTVCDAAPGHPHLGDCPNIHNERRAGSKGKGMESPATPDITGTKSASDGAADARVLDLRSGSRSLADDDRQGCDQDRERSHSTCAEIEAAWIEYADSATHPILHRLIFDSGYRACAAARDAEVERLRNQVEHWHSRFDAAQANWSEAVDELTSLRAAAGEEVARGIVQVVEYNDADQGGSLTVWTDNDPGEIEGQRVRILREGKP